MRRTSTEINKIIGGNIRKYRMELGLSQQEIGNALGTIYQQAQKFEKGKNRIAASQLLQLADYLKVDIIYFFHK